MERPGLIEPAMNERDTIFDKGPAILQAQDPTPVIYYLSDQVVSVKQDVLIEMVCFVAGLDSNGVQVECNIISNVNSKAFQAELAGVFQQGQKRIRPAIGEKITRGSQGD